MPRTLRDRLPWGGEGLTYGNFASAPHAESLNIYNVEGGDRAVGGGGLTYGNFASAPHAESLNSDIGGPGVRLPHRLSVYSTILALPRATLLQLAKFLPSTVVPGGHSSAPPVS